MMESSNWPELDYKPLYITLVLPIYSLGDDKSTVCFLHLFQMYVHFIIVFKHSGYTETQISLLVIPSISVFIIRTVI